VDQDKLVQVLDNLIGNALKFTDAEGTVTVSTSIRNDLLTISVEDTGSGISPEDQKKLFGKFQQISSQQKGKPMGSGLGLYISRELARKMGGDLWIEQSELGKGSTFAVSFPLAELTLARKIRQQLEYEATQRPAAK
jgi:signal transduction histidine kinase